MREDPAEAALEEEIWARCTRGDYAGAAEVALLGYGAQFRGYLSQRGSNRSPEDAADIFGEFQRNLLVGISTFQRTSDFRSWAFVVLRNTIARFVRKTSRERRERATETSVSELASEARTVSSHVRFRVNVGRFRAITDALSAAERELLELHVERGLSFEEISRGLGERGEPAAAAALRKRFERLQTKMEKMAAERGWR